MTYVRGAAGARYPEIAGFKARDTAADAAAGIETAGAKSLRARVYDSLKAMPATPETLAGRLGVPVYNIRPRCAELAKRGLIEDSGQRGTATGGRKAIVWKVTNAPADR